MKKIIFTLSSLLVLFLGSSWSLAAETTVESVELEDGVTMTVTTRDLTPLEIFEENNQELNSSDKLIEGNELQRGSSVPSGKKKISGSTTYSYSGTTLSGGGTLYSNYKFYGSTGYKITIKNTGSNTATVKAKRTLKTYASTSVSKNKSATIEFSGIKSDTQWWFQATGKGLKVSGVISKK